MSRSGIFILLLWSLILMACSFGFTVDRSALPPSAWDTAPSLDTYQKIFVDPALKGKMQVTDVDKILQAEDAETSKNQTHEKRSTTENIGTKMKFVEVKPINEIAPVIKNNALDSSEENANTAPRNVILLLIDERGQDEKKEENSWKNYKEKLPFAIEGIFQNCHDFKSANFSKDNASISEKKEKSDDCNVLRSNIGELLSWARQMKGMTTGAVSSSNFSIPFLPRYESRLNETNMRLEPRRSKRDSNDGWQAIDFSGRTRSPLSTADPKTGGELPAEENYDVTWDIFDMFSKIRMAFFRSLIESLHKNDDSFKDELVSVKPTATKLIGNTIKELKSVPNDKGYMLIAVAPRSEGSAVIDLFQREASPKDTLLIVTQICIGSQSSVPFIAQGPNYQLLQETKIIDELPVTIKKVIIARDCHDTECTKRQRHDVPIVSRVPNSEIFLQELPARKVP